MGRPGMRHRSSMRGRVSERSDMLCPGQDDSGTGRGRGRNCFSEGSGKERSGKRRTRYRSAAAFRRNLFLTGEDLYKSCPKDCPAECGCVCFLILAFLLAGRDCSLRSARALQAEEAARLNGAREKEIHRLCGEAIFWQPQKAEGYLRLYAYYEARGERQMGIYYVKGVSEGISGGTLRKREKEILEEKMLLFPEKVGYHEEK